MNERRAALITRIRELLEARRAELRAIARLEAMRPRVRILRTLACLMLLASTAQAGPMRQVSPAARPTCSPKVIIVVPVYGAPRAVINYGGGWNPMGR